MSTDAVTTIVSVLRPLRTELPDRAALAEALAPFRNTLPSAGALAEAIETEEGSPRSWTNLLVESWATAATSTHLGIDAEKLTRAASWSINPPIEHSAAYRWL